MSSAHHAPSGAVTEHTGPRIRIEPSRNPARATFNGQTVAESKTALVLHERGYPPRIYFPMADVRMDLLTATERQTHCPHKGDASYWTVAAKGTEAPNGAWAYRAPLNDVAAIRDHISFAEPIVTEA